jgi:hypothetical protein
MSRSQPPHPADVDGDHLEALASVLLAGVVLKAGDPAQLVRLRAGAEDLGPGEVELGLLPLDDVSHPLEGLLGLVAPPEWLAVGVVATGRATRLDEPGAGQRFPVCSVHLVGRTGCWAAAWRPLGDGAGAAGSASGDGGPAAPPAGRLDDALRRSLGLPTAPPPGSTHLLWATEWLDAVVEAAADRGDRVRLSAAGVIGLHPAVDALELDPATLELADVIAAGDRLAAWRGWAELREACAQGTWSHPLVEPEAASWLDDGAFARLALSGWPDLTDLRDAVGLLLTPEAAATVDEALASWGIPTAEKA